MKHLWGLRGKVIGACLLLALIICIGITCFSYVSYREKLIERYNERGENVTDLGLSLLEDLKSRSDKYDQYLDPSNMGRFDDDEDYRQIVKSFNQIKASFELEYFYVFALRNPSDPKGYIDYVISAIDESDNTNSAAEAEEDDNISDEFEEKYRAVLNGSSSEEYMITNTSKYGYLLTLIRPVHDSRGNVAAVIAADISMQTVLETLNSYILRITLVTACIVFAFIIVAGILVRKNIISPILLMSESVSQFVGTEGQLGFQPLDIKNKDELGELAKSVNAMADDVIEYAKNLELVTAERERIASDLRIATGIQADMLPKIFPPYADREDVHIATMMQPAKAVGGDFYDFFFLDDAQTKLALVIADVSGKGVPAALFMVIAKVLIKNNKDLPADQVLRAVNNLLCADNNSSMFVTTYYSVLDIKTGEYTYASAGHLPPVLFRKGDGSIAYLPLPKIPPIALFPNKDFVSQSITLEKGDTVFLYTDGVTEAFNTRSELYGTERLIQNLTVVAGEPVDRIVEDINQTIKEFAGEEPQSDDITMLCFRYFGPSKKI